MSQHTGKLTETTGKLKAKLPKSHKNTEKQSDFEYACHQRDQVFRYLFINVF